MYTVLLSSPKTPTRSQQANMYVCMYFTNRQSDPWDKALRRFKEDLHKDLEEILINIGKHVNYVWNKSHIKNLLRK